MNEGKRFVTDLQGVRYALGRQLGRGGQGAVFEVEGGRLAAKLLFDASPGRRERLLNQIAYVKRLPLEGVDIARPRAVLRDPDLGYVMDLLTGMAPLETLASPPRGVPSVARWYLEADPRPHRRGAGPNPWQRVCLRGSFSAERLRFRGRGRRRGAPYRRG